MSLLLLYLIAFSHPTASGPDLACAHAVVRRADLSSWSNAPDLNNGLMPSSFTGCLTNSGDLCFMTEGFQEVRQKRVRPLRYALMKIDGVWTARPRFHRGNAGGLHRELILNILPHAFCADGRHVYASGNLLDDLTTTALVKIDLSKPSQSRILRLTTDPPYDQGFWKGTEHLVKEGRIGPVEGWRAVPSRGADAWLVSGDLGTRVLNWDGTLRKRFEGKAHIRRYDAKLELALTVIGQPENARLIQTDLSGRQMVEREVRLPARGRPLEMAFLPSGRVLACLLEPGWTKDDKPVLYLSDKARTKFERVGTGFLRGVSMDNRLVLIGGKEFASPHWVVRIEE